MQRYRLKFPATVEWEVGDVTGKVSFVYEDGAFTATLGRLEPAEKKKLVAELENSELFDKL